MINSITLSRKAFAFDFLHNQGWCDLVLREDGTFSGFPDGWAEDYYWTENPLSHLREAYRYFYHFENLPRLEEFRKSEPYSKRLVNTISRTEEELAFNMCLALFEFRCNRRVVIIDDCDSSQE
jgi:hypothetical protein